MIFDPCEISTQGIFFGGGFVAFPVDFIVEDETFMVNVMMLALKRVPSFFLIKVIHMRHFSLFLN